MNPPSKNKLFLLFLHSVFLVFFALALSVNAAPFSSSILNTGADLSVETIPLQATVQVSPPKISIMTYAAGTFTISRKDPAVTTWTQIASGVALSASATWTDSAVTVGTAYEYKFVNTSGSASSGIYPTGYIICGIQYDQTQPKGIMGVVVASDLPVNLPAEYSQYKTDLIADGWNVREIQVPRAANYSGIGNGAIASVQIVQGGTGYSSGTVGMLNSSGKYAMGVLTTNTTTGAITAVSMNIAPGGVTAPGNAGAGFAIGDALSIVGGSGVGSGASLIGHVDLSQGTLSSYVYPVKGGSGFTAGDTVTLTGQTSHATASGTLNVSSSNGAISSISISNIGQTGTFQSNELLTMTGNTTGTGVVPITVSSVSNAQLITGDVTIASGGSAYTNGQSVTLTGQTSGKLAYAYLVTGGSGQITGFTIWYSYQGFIVGEHLTMTGNTGGSGVGILTVNAVSTGQLQYVQIHATGTGYVSGETATLTGSQSGKTAQVKLYPDSNGYLSYANVTSSQTGFIGNESLLLSGGSGTGAPPFTASVTGPLQSVTVVAGGSNYVNGNAVTINYGSTPAKGVLSVTSGSITGVTVTSGGVGFTDGNSVSLTGLITSNTSATLTVKTLDNSFAGRAVNVTAGGSGYTDNDPVAIKGASSGATANGSIIAIGGTMTAICVVLPNTFTPGESLTLTPSSGGSGATAVAGPNLEDHLLIRGVLQTIYNTFPGQLKNIVLIGKVPICRSGIEDGASADGHGNECPYGTDAFYADMDGVVGTDWTDTKDSSSDIYTDINLPGDKQFDQQSILTVGNGMVELGFGRIDFANGIQTEVEGERNYFNKLHRYKTASPDFLPGRMVCDRWTYANEREADLQSMPGVVGMNNIQFITTTNLPTVVGGADSDQAYTTQNGPYLFYFKGSGGPQAGVNGKAVFWTGMQSHWGFWYQSTQWNTMQQRLAENSFTLDFTWNIWGLRYIYHRMGMGYDAGDMMKQSINNDGWGNGPYTYKFNNTSNGSFHGALFMNQMGDPALRLFMFASPSGLSVVKTGGNPVLTWTASTDASVTGYHVYRAANANAFYTRLTSAPVSGTTYTDSTVTSGSYVYMVRAVRLENTGGGTFYNASLGITQGYSLDAAPTQVSNLTSSLPTFYWNTSGSAALTAQGGVPQYVWTIISGTLPAGLNLSPAGVISGTATGIGNFPITVQATDQIGQTQTQALTLTVSSNSQKVIYPVATTYTAQYYPSNSYGTYETDLIQGNPGSVDETFQRYDLSGLNAYNTVTKATLYLYVTANTGTTAIPDVQANLIADAVDGWVANGIQQWFSGAAASPTTGWTRITCPNHGFANGTQVTLAGLTGFPTTAYAITVIDANTFDIHITYGGWAYDPANSYATTLSMSYSTRPTTYDTNVPTITATGSNTPGTYLQFDVTSYVKEVLANFPSKQMGIRFFTGTPQTVYVGSLASFGGAIPYLVVQTSNAPNIVINSPVGPNPACIYSGQNILLNTTVTPLPSRVASTTLQWSKVSGPGTVTFKSPTSAATGAVFSAPGDYVLQLTANDGVASSSQTVTVRVLTTPVTNGVVTAPVTGPTSGLVLRLPLDETSGLVANDVSGVSPANNGSLAYVSGSSNPVWSSSGGRIGGALSFSGSGQQIVVPDSATNLLDGMTQMTISCWFYASSIATSGSYYNGLISKRYAAFNHESYAMGIRGGAPGPYSLYFDVGHTSTPCALKITTGKWYHVAMVFDGTLSNQNIKLYINGNPDVFTNTYSSGTTLQTSIPRYNNANLHIGAYDTSDTYGWNGLIDEVRIYNTALTFAQIQDLYNAAPTDMGPVITAPASVSGSAGIPFTLAATVNDDSGIPALNWSTLAGPGNATFDNPAAATTNATCALGGTFTLRLVASDGTIATFADVTANVTGQSFSGWTGSLGLSGSNAALLASPAGDRISNLMKYALGLNPNLVCVKPTDGTNPGLPLAGGDPSNLTLTYQKDTAKTDIAYVVESSTDMCNWTNALVTQIITGSNGTVQTIQASVPRGDNTHEFIRLRVTK